MKAKGELNLVAYLKHIRSQRNYLVQTEEQYIFIHDALAEAVASGETNIHRSYLSRYINSLQSSFTTDENSIPWQLLDRQFKLATAYHPQEAQFLAALKPGNQAKNQNFDYLPIESARVTITPKTGVEGSDYINASWLPGFQKLREFIITQHPLEQTVPDFWQMVWDHDVRTAVVLSPGQQPEFGVFWPTQQANIEFESLRVQLLNESEAGGCQTKDFNLHNVEDGSELRVRFIFAPGWPRFCQQLPAVADLTAVVHNIYSQTPGASSGPLLVVDRFGGTEAATFGAFSSLLKQLEFETHVDIYEYAKISHVRRPGIWRTQDDYFFLYRVLDSICSVGHVTPASNSPYEESSFQTFQPVSNGGITPTAGTQVTGFYQPQFLNGHPATTAAVCNGHGTIIRIPPDGRETLLRSTDAFQRF